MPRNDKQAVSGWDRYDQIMEAGGASIVVMVMAVLAFVLGIACFRWGAGDAAEWEGRPQETVTAELIDSTRRSSSDSDSGFYHTGQYRWVHDGSSGSFWSDEEWEQEGLIPRTLSVHVYQNDDGIWLLMGPHGEGAVSSGFLFLGGVVLCMGAAAAFLFALWYLRHGSD